jgi:low temperature requirement protein LtrA
VNQHRIVEVLLTVVVAVFLLVAAEGKHPYSFYMVLRTAATVGGAYWAVRVYRAGPRGWMWAFLAVALLLNPILPVRMHREDWQPIDVALGLLLLGWSGYWAFRRPRRL